MTELTHSAKVRLVTLLAQFSGPTDAAAIVSNEFGVTVDRRTAWKYDASKKGCSIGPRYRRLFHEVRDRWLNDLTTIAIGHQAHRLRLLDRLAIKLEEAGDYSGAMKAIELAAKEVGGLLTNERRATVSGSVVHVPVTVEEAREQLTARLTAAIEANVSPLASRP